MADGKSETTISGACREDFAVLFFEGCKDYADEKRVSPLHTKEACLGGGGVWLRRRNWKSLTDSMTGGSTLLQQAPASGGSTPLCHGCMGRGGGKGWDDAVSRAGARCERRRVLYRDGGAAEAAPGTPVEMVFRMNDGLFRCEATSRMVRSRGVGFLFDAMNAKVQWELNRLIAELSRAD